ncbi:MAG TPA: hypothetical protein VFO94_19315 [Gammaproteobacteria bacterium]|nr:hypothetical protein [Gammaproteobacteria bacterium]
MSEVWTPAELGRVVGGKSERTARDWLKAWEAEGLVARGESRNGWYFTEVEV